VFRNVGSISSPFGLASYLVPAAAFSAILALLMPRYRALGAIVFGAATAGIIGAQVRAGLVALLIGVVVGTIFALSLSDLRLRTKLTGVAAIVVLLLIGAGATAVASSVSPQLRSRAKGILNPLGDSNMKARIKVWRRTINEIRQHPLGTGVGTVGRASELSNGAIATTDNSYIKIAREQGLVGAPLFLAALVLATLAVLGGLYRAPPAARPLGIAALTGFFSFFIVAIAGEYIEQPGKVLAWTFLGLAAYQAWGTREAHETEAA
jgi:O-antigen ligase